MVTASSPDQPEPWATVRLYLPAEGHEGHGQEATASTVDRLDALGLLLADEAAVGGVERRDAGTLVGAPQPELWVYTTPAGLSDVLARAQALASELGLPVATEVEVHHDDDWRESWKRFYQPQVLGEGALLLRPSWAERREGDPEREVVLDPGRAFGAGLHQSTRLCLQRLCAQQAEGLRPRHVIDIGCGSGILVLAAARLYPQARLWALDNDPESVETAEENAALNGVRERVALWVGDADALDVLALAAQPTSAPGGAEGPSMDLVVANIRPQVLVPLAPALRRLLAPGARVLLSGILVEEAPPVRAAYEAEGLVHVDAEGMIDGEWQAIELRVP
jgi:ribosomal protein L11 methyltransferase